MNALMRVMVGSTREGRNPLLVHTVQDDSNPSQYLPQVNRWLSWCGEKDVSVDTVDERDEAMADYFAHACYVECSLPWRGKSTLAGYGHLYPEHQGLLKRAARALKGWRKLFAQLEREPVPVILLFLFIVDAMCDGEWGESASYVLHMCGFLREEDIFQAAGWDFTHLGAFINLLLGDASRGESVKTGVDQGVEIREAWAVRILRAYLRKRRRAPRVFTFTQKKYRQGFQRRLRKYGARPQRGVYVIRHSATAEFVAKALADTEQKEDTAGVMERARRIGRWSDIRPMQVYTKTHLLARALEGLDVEVRRRGAYLQENLDLLADIWEKEFVADGEREVGNPSKMRDFWLRPGPGYVLPERYTSFVFDEAATGPDASGEEGE